MMVRRLLLLTGMIVGLAISWGTAHIMFGWQPFLPPLVAGWPEEAEFAQRVASRFPNGIAEADMVQELSRQGFATSAAGKPGMRRLTSRFPCDWLWYVEWDVDDAGKATAITGKMHRMCM